MCLVFVLHFLVFFDIRWHCFSIFRLNTGLNRLTHSLNRLLMAFFHYQLRLSIINIIFLSINGITVLIDGINRL